MAGIALLFLSTLAWANDADPGAPVPDTDEAGMEVVMVVGVQPGPGLWKVTSGEHFMWILGEISPSARRVEWKSGRFENLLRNSQELLLDFSGYWSANHSETRQLAYAELLPSGVTLKDVIGPELHDRVESLARRFDAPRMEDMHPFAVTNHLAVSAMDSLDLKSFSARFAAQQLARKVHVKVTRFAVPEIPFPERLRNWQDASNAICLQRLVATIGDGGSGVRRLANAWSVGDISALRQLVPSYSFSRDGFRADECAAAMHGGEKQAREYKLRRTRAWLKEAKRVLRTNESTMAVVLMSELFASDGYLAALRAEGFEISEPQ